MANLLRKFLRYREKHRIKSNALAILALIFWRQVLMIFAFGIIYIDCRWVVLHTLGEIHDFATDVKHELLK
ncbi:hypothetical protein ACI3E1_07045 [Ligilactobacillus sp. LYQ139]|uniref:hypothetical protein n=1 Tax=Ligilactobacillus sp. LYQ139 TaxID=3378800 RepID=UPI003854010E